ncbi:MAG: sigma-70 family RNA polymerase sigma factor [Odoribacter sp.]|nr:sigma-70 family RNA polymerase sigma factor [Odoribacter sp.]
MENKLSVANKAEQDEEITKIYQKYNKQLKRYISDRVSVREEGEDILQNVFYILSQIDLINNPIERISSWLYKVTRNQIIDRSRKHKEEKFSSYMSAKEEEDFLGTLSSIMESTDNSPETEFLKTLIWEELENALEELPLEQQSVFELTEMKGFSFKELSKSTGIPVNTLIARKRYAVLHLRNRLQPLYEELMTA